jgi:hypothetical protein
MLFIIRFSDEHGTNPDVSLFERAERLVSEGQFKNMASIFPKKLWMLSITARCITWKERYRLILLR